MGLKLPIESRRVEIYHNEMCLPGEPNIMTKIKKIIDKNAPFGERCPICKALIISRARCPQSNSECENGHKWYYLGKEIIIDKGWESFAGMNINLIMKK